MAVLPGARLVAALLRTGLNSHADDEVVLFAQEGEPSGATLPSGQTLSSSQVALCVQQDADNSESMLWRTADGGTTWVRVADDATATRYDNGLASWADVGDGSTAGTLRTSQIADYRIGGTLYRKAATDDLWDLSGETDTDGSTYRAYYLYLDAAGTASIGAGTDAASAALALAALPSVPSAKSVCGVFVAGVSCDFDDAGGLEAQGTVYTGWAGSVV
jgi:hypothetical protein